MSKDSSFPEIAVKRERRCDGKLTGGQDRSGSCVCLQAPVFSVREEVWPPA